MAYSTLPAITGFTEPLPLDKSGDPDAFNASIQRWITELNAYAISLNGDWRTKWNASVRDVNTIVTNTPAINTCASNVPAIIDVNANEANINAVHTDMASVVRCASNMPAIVDAKNQADKSATQATIATKAADRAVAVAGVDVATDEKAGLARGDWDTITTDSGVLSAPAPIVVPWTLTAAVAVNDLVPVPRAYLVGKNEFVLYKNGVALAQSDYEEVGPDGELSTLIRAKFTAASGDKLMLYGPFSLRPLLVIDPSQGVVDPRLVCTRAGSTWVTGPDGKITEVPANVVPIDWSTGVGRIACFGQRTRLNPNYKTKGSNIFAPAVRGVSNTNVPDALSPTGSAIRLRYTAANNTEGSPYPYFLVLVNAFVPQVGVYADTAYTVSVCVRASRQIESLIELKKDNNILTNNKTITISTEYEVFSITTVIPAGSFLYAFAMPLSSLNDGESLDMAWYQVEQSSCATPLIAGPEGQQVTVPGQYIRVADNDFEKTDEHFDSLTVFSEISALENSKMMKRRVAYIGTLSVSSFFDPYLKGPAPFKYELACRKDAEPTIVTLPQTTPMASKACFRLSNGKMTVATKAQYSDKLLTDAMAISKERLFVGSRAVVNDYILDGYICKLLIWPIALPDAQLKALTAE